MTPPRQSVGFQTGKTTAAFADFLVGDAGIEPGDPSRVQSGRYMGIVKRRSARLNAEVESKYLVCDTLPLRREATAACALAEPKSPGQQRVCMTIWREGLEELRHDIRLTQMVQGLCGRVDLVVVLRSWEADKLCHIFVEPCPAAGQEHAAALEPVAAGVQAHDLVGARRRLVFDDLMDAFVTQVLDELNPGAFVLDDFSPKAASADPTNTRTDRPRTISPINNSSE
jgi:hypothetical protein